MLIKNLKLAGIILLVFANMTRTNEIDLTNQSCTPDNLNSLITDVTSIKHTDVNNANSTELAELKTKVCAALAVLKCTLYKLETILTDINDIGYCENNTPICDDNSPCSDNDDDNYNDNDNDDDCPSLDFDDDCPSLDFDNCCDSYVACCDDNGAKLPINININCKNNQKVKVYFKLQTCKKLKHSLNK